MKNLIRYSLLISILLLVRCSAPSGTVTSYNTGDSATDKYIAQYAPTAISEMKRTGIPASITMAQGILESNNGNSELSRVANNHFGIKCHKWTGRKYYHDDDARNECFRHYKSAWESYRDHSDFLKNNARYSFLFDYSTKDYKSWAHGLKKAGYATDSHYPKKLIDIIERYQLHNLDEGKGHFAVEKTQDDEAETDYEDKQEIKQGKKGKRTIYTNNRTSYILAEENDSYQRIANEFEMLGWEIYKYNDLPKTASITKGQRIYIEPKQKRAERGINIHIVIEGETMYTIAQKYAIQLKKLYSMNDMKTGDKLTPGQTLIVRPKKKASEVEAQQMIEFDF